MAPSNFSPRSSIALVLQPSMRTTCRSTCFRAHFVRHSPSPLARTARSSHASAARDIFRCPVSPQATVGTFDAETRPRRSHGTKAPQSQQPGQIRRKRQMQLRANPCLRVTLRPDATASQHSRESPGSPLPCACMWIPLRWSQMIILGGA